METNHHHIASAVELEFLLSLKINSGAAPPRCHNSKSATAICQRARDTFAGKKHPPTSRKKKSQWRKRNLGGGGRRRPGVLHSAS
jgi:hypothetical protein